MNFSAEIEIENSCAYSRKLILEPWGEELKIPPGEKFLCRAIADQKGDFEIEEKNDEIIVYVWSGATVKVFCQGIEIGGDRPTVPEVPEGFNTSIFLEFMFGKKADQ